MSFWETFNFNEGCFCFAWVKPSCNFFFPKTQIVKVNKNTNLSLNKEYSHRHVGKPFSFSSLHNRYILALFFIKIFTFLLAYQWVNGITRACNLNHWFLFLLVIMISWVNIFLYKISPLKGRLIKDNACERSLEAKCYGVKSLRDLVLNFSMCMMP